MDKQGQLDNLRAVARALKELERRKLYNHIEFFEPYPKQIEFMDYGRLYRERLLMAGNQLGKTEVGAFETALHLTGEYPDWWTGRRWERPVKGWASGVTGLSTRDVVQKKLMGEAGVVSARGTGMIPRHAIVDVTGSRSAPDAIDTVTVRHKSGGLSILKFKSYEQGREKWQGDTIDFLWFDEEAPDDIYSEGLSRLVGDGMTFTTFTPLKGMSEVVMRFMNENSQDRIVVNMTIDDVTHFTQEEKDMRVRGYKAYEREARRNGVPMMGEGRVFQTPEEAISEDPIEFIPKEWTWLWGIDFGVGHPFAAALILWDREADIIHVRHVLRLRGEDGEDQSRPIYHAAAMKPFGWIPVAWPHDGNNRDKGSGDPLSRIYKSHGLRMRDTNAKFPDGSTSVEAGVAEMDERMATGKLKVARQLKEFFEEYRNYHREKGLIVAKHDDVLSAVRYALMDKRFSLPHRQLIKPSRDGAIGGIAKGVDFALN